MTRRSACGAPSAWCRRWPAGMPPAAGVVVGEPTEMQVVTGHKGGLMLYTHVRGFEVHSSIVHTGVSAVMTAARLVTWLEDQMEANRQAAEPGSNRRPALRPALHDAACRADRGRHGAQHRGARLHLLDRHPHVAERELGRLAGALQGQGRRGRGRDEGGPPRGRHRDRGARRPAGLPARAGRRGRGAVPAADGRQRRSTPSAMAPRRACSRTAAIRPASAGRARSPRRTSRTSSSRSASSTPGRLSWTG